MPYYPGDTWAGGTIHAEVVIACVWAAIGYPNPPAVWWFSGDGDDGLNSPYLSIRDGDGKVVGGNCRGVKTCRPSVAAGATSVTLGTYSVYMTATGCCNSGTVVLGRGITASATVVAVHAHPTSFRQTAGERSGDGSVLTFHYAWDSTSGYLQDLTACTVGEIVIYPTQGNPVGSTLLDPPWDTSNGGWGANRFPNPTVTSGPATVGQGTDDHDHDGFQSPYVADSFNGVQRYRFH